MMPSRGYLLCSVERTGSNLLAQALAGTGVAGKPLEYFSAVEQKAAWMREILGDSAMLDGVAKLLTAGTTDNGVFGAKIHWNHFRHLGMSIRGVWSESERVAPYELLRSRLPDLLALDDAHRALESRFPDHCAQAAAYEFLREWLPDLRVVWLQRRNMIACAISHFRARQTGIWYQPSSGRDQLPDDSPPFDLAEIHNLYCLGTFQQNSWARFFQERNLHPHCVFYEDLAESRAHTVRQVLDFLGLGRAQAAIPQPRSIRQSGRDSAEWEVRYRTWAEQWGI